MATTETPILTERFDKAMALALDLHRLHTRKSRGAKTPYACHLMTVTGMVLELGGDEDEAIAAILHDSVEDQLDRLLAKIEHFKTKDESMLSVKENAAFAYLENMFGARVRMIIEGLTDEKLPKEFKKLPRAQRMEFVKENRAKKIEKLKTADSSIRRVKGCDTLHNLRSLLQDYRQSGPDVWLNFVGHKEGTLWYYERMADMFYEYGPAICGVEMHNALERLKTLVKDEGAL